MKPILSLVRALAALMLLLVAIATPVSTIAQDATPVAAQSIRVFGITGDVTLTVDELKTLPVASADVTFMASGEEQQHSFTGTSLLGVLEHIGLPFPEGAKNPLLQTWLVVTANDGYQVVISGGELDPSFGNVPMLLAWEQDGAPLAGTDGPLRLVVPGDTKGGRYVHGIVSIEVLNLDPAIGAGGGNSATPAAATPAA
ncbi:MAG TPA: molybdopterin-dependent oxidoreductase [Thermomicrobiales bacterium]|nr:molybdopterin-dependent oxidoreductase [Thermomicrobiales bacterium]